MSKQVRPHMTEMQVEGTAIERAAERRDAQQQAHILMAKLPSGWNSAQRQAYIRDLVVKALRKEIDPMTFEAFVMLTNIQREVDAVLTRARLIARR